MRRCTHEPRPDDSTARVRTLKIDDQDIGAREDQTILEAAREHGIDIPTLCHLEGLSDVGACRLCLVEIKGVNRLQAACVTHGRRKAWRW